ncbi:hypothetical protein CBS101457_003096 [Exobasidium rhododendri]|nr:hypothetical protein CBS101457_003096 [Exobasidium rhododendri]
MSATILVSGASGKLGVKVIEQLIAHGAKPSSIAALVRSEEKGQELKKKGVQLRIGDYNDVKALETAVKGIKRALLISGSNIGSRLAEHSNFIQALVKSDEKVELIAYTSFLLAQTNPILLADEHKQTEQAIEKSGLPYSFLRNGWYIENTVDQIGVWSQTGGILGATGSGRVNAASRKDFAEAAALVLLAEKGSFKSIYELGGNPGYTLDELAALASKVLGKPIHAVHQSKEVYNKSLVSFGLPAPFASILADAEDKAASGHLATKTNDLQTLIGRESESIEHVMRETLKAQSS